VINSILGFMIGFALGIVIFHFIIWPFVVRPLADHPKVEGFMFGLFDKLGL
jgi:hypothetical protein